MKLSTKLSLLVLGVILPVVIFFYLLNASFILKEAKKYERDLGTKQGLRLKEQISKQFEAVRTSSRDWGAWDDTFWFVQGRKDSFIKDNLSEPTIALTALRSDFILIIKRDGSIVYSIAGDFEAKKGIAVPDYVKDEFSRITYEFFQNKGKSKNPVEGFFLHANGAYLFSSNTILHSDYSGTPQGLIFLGRRVDTHLIKSFQDVLQGEIDFINMASPQQQNIMGVLKDTLIANEPWVDLHDESLDVYLALPSYRLDSQLVAVAKLDRYMSGILYHILKREALLWLFVALLLMGMFFIGNHYFILKKIQYFCMIFNKVKGQHDLSLRAEEKGGDEFSEMAQGFNHMMGALFIKQQQLVHSSKMASVGILTSGVAHEINNPLFIAKGYVQILIRKASKDEALKNHEECLMQADVALGRIEDIVKTLQQYSKGNEVANKEIVQLNHIIEDALLVSKTRMGRAEIQVKANVPKERFEIEGAFSSVQQIVINLLVNAIEALELVPSNQRFLNISLLKKEQRILLSITDSGPGIKPENLSKIYDPFFTTKEVGKGIGLGLFTVHSFVQSLGGEIICETELGKGTCFRISFPECPPLKIENS